MKRHCIDDNPKVVTRVYIWDGRQVEIDLCEDHRKDSDFERFVSEHRIEEIVA